MSMAQKDDQRSRTIRLAAGVIICAMLLWMGVNWLGGELGFPRRYAFLADLVALAAFAWAGLVLYRLYQTRDEE